MVIVCMFVVIVNWWSGSTSRETASRRCHERDLGNMAREIETKENENKKGTASSF